MKSRLPGIQISFAKGVCEHVRLGPKISETVKGKWSLGVRIVQGGGLQKVFRQIFSVEQGEKLLKVCQCYLSTTAGPIAGLLFISTEKVAFCSERPVTFSTPNGGLIRTSYKVTIPLEKIKRATQSENVNKPSQKYIEIFTVDKFDFWFMGFVNYEKAFKNLQQAISTSQSLLNRRYLLSILGFILLICLLLAIFDNLWTKLRTDEWLSCPRKFLCP